MSPKDFRKISHPEPKILNSLVNCGHTHTHTHGRTSVNLELTPPEGGSAKNELNQLVIGFRLKYSCSTGFFN